MIAAIWKLRSKFWSTFFILLLYRMEEPSDKEVYFTLLSMWNNTAQSAEIEQLP